MSETIKEITTEEADTDHTSEAIPAGKQPFILADAPADPIPETIPKEVHSPDHRHFTEEERSEAFQTVKKDLAEHSETFSPAEEIAFKITEDHITEYLEGSREERMQRFKEEREKRLLTAFELASALASVVLVVYFLKDNPAILVNILYIIGALAGLWLWKNPHNHSKEDKKDE